MNDFLIPARRQVTFSHAVKEQTSIKDAMAALGVPHPETEVILV
ncbi:MAG: hypothetical protein KTR27_18145 [Leptolyngbyaceae cyanobacterium MAG.088]|nr:hypothetical protein [Leptolyngbyaceae cyanobacterium MAG.088]